MVEVKIMLYIQSIYWVFQSKMYQLITLAQQFQVTPSERQLFPTQAEIALL